MLDPVAQIFTRQRFAAYDAASSGLYPKSTTQITSNELEPEKKQRKLSEMTLNNAIIFSTRHVHARRDTMPVITTKLDKQGRYRSVSRRQFPSDSSHEFQAACKSTDTPVLHSLLSLCCNPQALKNFPFRQFFSRAKIKVGILCC